MPAPLPDHFTRPHWAQLHSSPRAEVSRGMGRDGQVQGRARVHMAGPPRERESGDSVPLVVCARPLLPLKPWPVMTCVGRTAA